MYDRLSTVATFNDPIAAALARSFLDGHGIPAILIDETTIATDWLLAGAIGGIKLQVASVNVERAELLLEQIKEKCATLEGRPVPDHAIAAHPETAMEIASEREDKAEINRHVDRLFRATVFGWLFWPLHFYTLFMLAQLCAMDGTVSANRRWKVWIAVCLNLPILAASFFAIACGWNSLGSR